MDMQQIWQAVEPYVMWAIGAIVGGTSIYALAKFFLKKVFKRFEEKYEVNDMANKVADKLAGKTLNIDVTAVTEKRLDKLDKKLSKAVERIHSETAAYKHLLALIGGAMTKLKAVTAEERNALNDAITALESDFTPPEPEEVVTVKLEPIVTAPQETKDETAADRFL